MKNVRVELVIAGVRAGRVEVLLVRLPGSVGALPGSEVPAGRRVEDAAHDALAEGAGIRGLSLEQLYTFDRDGERAITVAHLGLVAAERHPPSPGPGVVEVRWFPLDDLPALDPDALEVIGYGRSRMRAKAAYAPIALQLLPELFTLAELQAVYEAVLERRLDTRNFRRDVLSAGVVEPVGRARADRPGRPASLYRSRAAADFQVLARERRIARAIAGASTHGGET
jgi:8-oxo-dGTP diphosphatase